MSTPDATEYHLLVNRFKLLNLVQRIAHRDVMTLIDAVGLEPLVHKEASLHAIQFPATTRDRKGAWQLKQASSSPGPSHRFTSGLPSREVYGTDAGTRGNDRSRPMGSASRNADRGASNFESKPVQQGKQVRVRRVPYNREREAFFSRLARPKAMYGEPEIENVTIYEDPPRGAEVYRDETYQSGALAPSVERASPTAGFRQAPPIPGDWGAYPNSTAAAAGVSQYPGEQQRSAPYAAAGILGKGSSDPSLPPSAPMQLVALDAEESHPADRPSAPSALEPQQLEAVAARDSLQTDSGSPASPNSDPQASPKGILTRSGGLGKAKSKPQMAPETPSAPQDIVKHAAAILAKINAPARPPESPISSQNKKQMTPRTIRAHTAVNIHHAPGTDSDSAGTEQKSNREPPAHSRFTREYFKELSTSIDDMLRDHQQLLRKVAAVDAKGATAPSDSDQDSNEASSPEGKNGPVSRKALHLYPYYAGDKDEMYLLGDINRRLNTIDRDIDQVVGRRGTELTQSGEENTNVGGSEEGKANELLLEPSNRNAPQLEGNVANKYATDKQKRTTKRGTLSPAIVERLNKFRKENCEYIAFNEKLWNSSPVSQYVFAERLTNALFEDCYGDVVNEVLFIMDDYVDSVTEHELQ